MSVAAQQQRACLWATDKRTDKPMDIAIAFLHRTSVARRAFIHSSTTVWHSLPSNLTLRCNYLLSSII